MAEITAFPDILRPPLLNLRWSAVFAGLAVGIVANLVLLLIGAAVGLAAFNAGATADETALLVAVSVWDTVSMVIGAVLGGYVAARASGMRRTQDGILHGVLAWSAAMLIGIAIATSAASGAFGDVLSGFTGRPAAESESGAPTLGEGERAAIVRDLELRFGLTPEQANAIADEIVAMAARPPEPDPAESLRSATLIGAWISAAVLLSLLGAIGGGMLGSRGSRRGGREVPRTTAERPGDFPAAERPPYEP